MDTTTPLRHRRDTLTAEQVRALPAVVDLDTARRAFGLSRTIAYRLAREGRWPCPLLRVGNAYRVSRASILAALGMADAAPLPGESLASGPLAQVTALATDSQSVVPSH